MLKALCLALAAGCFFLLPDGPAKADDTFDIISVEHPSASVEIVRIRQPNVKKAVTAYPSITFQPKDQVVLAAGGCVQTGGSGATWKRYVDPSGEDSSKYYFGEIWIPGITGVMQPIEGAIAANPLYVPPGTSTDNLFLRLGYSDDDLSDNGYYDHDDGTENQCAGQAGGAAWVTLTITHNVDPPTSSGEVAPFDLFWGQADSNGIPLEAIWGESVNHRRDPANHPSALPGDDICATPWLLPCTTQAPTLDMASWPNTWVSCDWLGGPLVGHANWGPGTYQGTLRWESKSNAGADDDYSINLTTPDNDGATAGRSEGYHIEFDSDETVDHFGSVWWNSFQTAVDIDEPTAAQEIKDKFAVVTGLVDLDCAHPCSGELHPVYALFIRTSDDPAHETWAFFVRNWGNEGGCASDNHQLLLDGDKYTVTLPWLPGGTSVGLSTYDIKTNSDAVSVTGPIPVPGAGVKLIFQLDRPENQSSVDGMIQFKWTTTRVFGGAPVVVEGLRAPVRERERRLLTAPYGGTRDDMLPPLTAAQLAIFKAHLPETSDDRNARKLTIKSDEAELAVAARLEASRIGGTRLVVPRIRSVYDPKKHAGDQARFEALLAAFEGKIPGRPPRLESGIGGEILHPAPK